MLLSPFDLIKALEHLFYEPSSKAEVDGMMWYCCINHVVACVLEQVGHCAVLQESRLIFFECSAFSGQNVTESMVHLARYASIKLN